MQHLWGPKSTEPASAAFPKSPEVLEHSRENPTEAGRLPRPVLKADTAGGAWGPAVAQPKPTKQLTPGLQAVVWELSSKCAITAPHNTKYRTPSPLVSSTCGPDH